MPAGCANDIDLVMLAALGNGQTNGRLLIEMGLARPDQAAWNRIAFDGVVAAMAGTLPPVSLDG